MAAHVGHFDKRAQAEVIRALRSDTPEQFKGRRGRPSGVPRECGNEAATGALKGGRHHGQGIVSNVEAVRFFHGWGPKRLLPREEKDTASTFDTSSGRRRKGIST